mgnify:CR=1 FL=1
MRVAILSDIHANWEALTAVLTHMQSQSIDACWFLGDVMGYNADAIRCSQKLQQIVSPEGWIAGNHDRGVTGQLSHGYFPNHDARHKSEAWIVVEKHMVDMADKVEDVKFLAGLPSYRRPQHRGVEFNDVWLVHGRVTQHENKAFEEIDNLTGNQSYIYRYTEDTVYASKTWEVLANRGNEPPRIILAGHTHHAMVWRRTMAETNSSYGWIVSDDDQSRRLSHQSLALREDTLWINPGSIGQPRDGNPQASYALLDFNKNEVVFHRVPYDIEKTQKKMQQQGYPQRFIQRLAEGK